MIVLILYSIIHLLEAWLEEIVIAMKNYTDFNYQQMNRAEHKRSAVLAFAWFICAALICWHMEQWWIMAALVPNRRIFFDYGLILMRDRPRRLYEGDDWWANRFKWLFGKRGRIIELVLELAITAFCICMHLLTSKIIL